MGMKDQSQAPQWMVDTHKVIQEADGFVVVTPEYNCSLPPALTNLLDYFPPAPFRHKPVSIAAYSMGPFGGIRAAQLARPFLSELGLVPLPSTLLIPTVQNANIPESGEEVDNERVMKNSERSARSSSGTSEPSAATLLNKDLVQLNLCQYIFFLPIYHVDVVGLASNLHRSMDFTIVISSQGFISKYEQAYK